MNSDAVQTRVVRAYDRLWERNIKLGKLPRSFSVVGLLFTGILSPAEVDRMLDEKDELRFLSTTEEFIGLMDVLAIPEEQPYIKQRTWEMSQAKMSFVGRILIIASEEGRNKWKLADWKEDDLLKEHVANGVSIDTLTPELQMPDLLRLWDMLILSQVRADLSLPS